VAAGELEAGLGAGALLVALLGEEAGRQAALGGRHPQAGALEQLGGEVLVGGEARGDRVIERRQGADHHPAPRAVVDLEQVAVLGVEDAESPAQPLGGVAGQRDGSGQPLLAAHPCRG
jgi:hypothetical protein